MNSKGHGHVVSAECDCSLKPAVILDPFLAAKTRGPFAILPLAGGQISPQTIA